MSLVAVMNTNKGTIRLDLFADQAPMTVANFVNLAQRGFNDNPDRRCQCLTGIPPES